MKVKNKMCNYLIRSMEVGDLSEVLKVEEESFTETWPKDIFYKELTDNEYAHYFIIAIQEKIIGYAGLWVVMDDAQITNIAIMPAYRGQSYGEKLFYYVLQQAIVLGAKRLSLEVRVSNKVAQNMYRK